MPSELAGADKNKLDLADCELDADVMGYRRGYPWVRIYIFVEPALKRVLSQSEGNKWVILQSALWNVWQEKNYSLRKGVPIWEKIFLYTKTWVLSEIGLECSASPNLLSLQKIKNVGASIALGKCVLVWHEKSGKHSLGKGNSKRTSHKKVEAPVV